MRPGLLRVALAWLFATGGTGAPLTAQTREPLTTAQRDSALVRFLSTQMARQMKALGVPGAVVTVVRGGRTVMSAAFGNATVSPAVTAHAESTAFRIASVTKVFTALAALRVAESGRIGLQTDVHPIVPDIPIRGRVTGPLTLHQLLTHTAGFDDRNIGYLNPAGAQPEPLGRHLARALPERTRDATNTPGYSNHGYGLAGLIVERATGIPFPTYVRDSILLPLGMTSTRFVLAPSDTVGVRLAAEYRSSGDRRVPRSSRPYPAGNLATTAADMGRFLIALDRALRGDSVPVISPSVARQLAGPVLTYHPDLPPMGYGLSGVPVSGETVWMKGGASPSHSAVLAMLPAHDVGVFIGVNRQEPLVWVRVLPALVAHLQGRDSSGGTAPPNERKAASPASELDGTYLWTRVPLASPERVLGLDAQVSVATTGGGVHVRGFGELAGTYLVVDSLLFERADGRRIAFRKAPNARASHLFSIVQGQPVSLERIPVTQSSQVQLGAFLVASVVVLLAAVVALWASRRRRPAAFPHWTRAAMVALPVALILAVAAAVALAGEGDRLQQEPTPLLRLLLVLLTLSAVIAVAQIASAARLALQSPASPFTRVIYVAGAIGGGLMVWFLVSNNLVGHWTS